MFKILVPIAISAAIAGYVWYNKRLKDEPSFEHPLDTGDE